MLDLHLFLGRPLMNKYVVSSNSSSHGAKEVAPKGYDLVDLNPELVHYGNFPQQVRER